MSVFVFLLVITSSVLLITYSVLVNCYEIEVVTAAQDGLLESPQWSVQENALYWVNNFGQKLFRMDGATGEITSRDVGYGPTTLIMPVRDYPGYVVVAVRSGLYLLEWGAAGGDLALRLLTTVDLGKPDNNIDDGKADAAGRLWFGTFGKLDLSQETFVPPDQATLYSIDACNFARPAVKKRPVSLSNGIAWSLDNQKMYYNDSPTRTIAAFDYDLEKGTIGNETVIFRFDDHDVPGVPDGMTIDVDGNIWVATFNKMILNIEPRSGQLLKKIELPVDQISSVMWGGPRLEWLFVTTGGLHVAEPLPMSGSLLKVAALGTTGVPENQFVFPDAPDY